MFEFKQVTTTEPAPEQKIIFKPSLATPRMLARGEIDQMIMKYIREINTLAAKRKS